MCENLNIGIKHTAADGPWQNAKQDNQDMLQGNHQHCMVQQ